MSLAAFFLAAFCLAEWHHHTLIGAMVPCCWTECHHHNAACQNAACQNAAGAKLGEGEKAQLGEGEGAELGEGEKA